VYFLTYNFFETFWNEPESWLLFLSFYRFSVPAGGGVVEPVGGAEGPAGVGEVGHVEDGQRVVDVAAHGVLRVVAVRIHREGPVVHQPRDHVRREGDDHGL